MPNLYIVLPVHNRLASTRIFLSSLAEQTVQNYKLIICDDGSTDGTGEYLATRHPEVTVVNGNGNLWWTAGINKCLELVLSECADFDHILTLNNDVVLPPDYLERKLERAVSNPDAIIGSLCVYSDNPNIIETSGYIMDFDKCEGRRLTRPGEVRTNNHTGIREVTHLPGKGVLFPAKVFRKIGMYDEANLPQYHADTDLTLRAHKAGFKVFVDFESVVFSEVNVNNMVLPTHEITLKGIISSFIGPYSMNNYWVYNNFAKKHFPNNRFKYLSKKYFKIVGGFAKRLLKQTYHKVFNR